MATPNFILKEPFTLSCGQSHLDDRVLEAGSWVRPIEFCYVPKEVKEDPRWKYFDKNTEIFCYTHWGLIPIPKKSLREK